MDAEVVPNPKPGVGCPASSCVLHSSGAVLNAPQIAFSRDTESLPACASAPLIISVGEPPTWYFSLSALLMSNNGYRPFSHVDWSAKFASTLNSASVLVVHAESFALSIPTSLRHAASSAGVPVFPSQQVK